MNAENDNLTAEQKELLYLLSLTTNSVECTSNWIKETPLQALIFYGIRKGVFNDYDYAPISTPFLGKGRKFVNVSKEGEDDLGDLRELGLIETIRISSSKHDYITGYRPTNEAKKVLNTLHNQLKDRINNLFICPQCSSKNYSLKIDSSSSEFKMECPECNALEEIPLVVPEDVSYTTKPYFFKFLEKKNKPKED